MTITAEFGPNDIRMQVEKTGIKGRHLTFIDDFTAKELDNIFKTAVMLEPYWRSRTPMLEGKVLCTQFFQPSTRTRFSHETAMIRLGGHVITESNPMVSSSAAKGESLYDSLRVTSQYADVIVLRHPDENTVDTIEELGSDSSPVISGGYGNITHPTQGLLDMYTAYRALGGDFKKMTVMIATPDLSRARSGQSFGLGLARMGAKLIYSGTRGLETPNTIRNKLEEMNADFKEFNNLTIGQHEQMIADEDVDLVYLPGCSVKKGDPGRDDFLKKMAEYYFTLEGLQKIKKKTGKTVGLMHSLPRNEGEFDFAIDNSEHELYFKQIGFSVPLRMSLLANICGI
ncbi:MAG: aspartate carbamoyltransferase [Verrucomicrobiota bacterium]|nr:aspartate carbamoyltransferase [Verrucomicrobiota bacterium]